MKQWEQDDDYGSDILGNGQAWGDMRGKVKTKQIGFVRNEQTKNPPKAKRQSSVRSQKAKPPVKVRNR